MTREEVFAAMTTMQYWLKGERIQVSGPCGSWVDVADNEFPSWDWSSYRWRVKPHTVAPRGYDYCDPTSDSPDPVVVRLEAERDALAATCVDAADRIDSLHTDNTRLRGLLREAVKAWESANGGWDELPIHPISITLNKDWRDRSTAALEGKP